MSKVIAIMSMSLDGFVADPNNGVSEVFDWYFSSGDEISVDIAALFLGSGVRLFDHLAGTRATLGNPVVIQGAGVTHLRYPVSYR